MLRENTILLFELQVIFSLFLEVEVEEITTNIYSCMEHSYGNYLEEQI